MKIFSLALTNEDYIHNFVLKNKLHYLLFCTINRKCVNISA